MPNSEHAQVIVEAAQQAGLIFQVKKGGSQVAVKPEILAELLTSGDVTIDSIHMTFTDAGWHKLDALPSTFLPIRD